MNPKLQLIREKCIAANPDLQESMTECNKCGGRGFFEGHDSDDTHGGTGECLSCPIKTQCPECRGERFIVRPIHLADVLLLLGDAFNGSVGINGETFVWKVTEGEWREDQPQHYYPWNLRADDLEKQSEETINFLYELLK